MATTGAYDAVVTGNNLNHLAYRLQKIEAANTVAATDGDTTKIAKNDRPLSVRHGAVVQIPDEPERPLSWRQYAGIA